MINNDNINFLKIIIIYISYLINKVNEVQTQMSKNQKI